MSRPEPAQPVRVEMSEGVAWITLDRPERLNAMDELLMDQLVASVRSAALDPDVRCVVVRGAGRAFSSGGDVRMIVDRHDAAARSTISSSARMLALQAKLVERAESSVLLATMPKPSVAALHGHVVGGAVALALATDVRIARSDTIIRMGFAHRGLSGDFGISALLSRAVGDARARALLLEDPEIDAATALSLGLVTRVVGPEDFDAEVDETARRLASGPTVAFGRMKATLAALDAGRLRHSIEIEALHQRVSAGTRDAVEAGEAFLERRTPEFRGD